MEGEGSIILAQKKQGGGEGKVCIAYGRSQLNTY